MPTSRTKNWTSLSPKAKASFAKLALAVADAKATKARRHIDWWAENYFYIPETASPIMLEPHQRAILKFVFERNQDGRFPFQTILFSTPKKSGKTTIAGMVGRWAAETWGRYGEVLYVGNDADQARERGFAVHKQSVELDPQYDRSRQVLPGLWLLQESKAKCLSTGTKVKAIATDYQGEAGANPILSVWTELWGFIDKAALRFWAEIGPSPTRPDSIRWIETYAGYEGESELLESLYNLGMKQGRQLTAGELGSLQAFGEAPNEDSPVPCWVNEKVKFFMYWDSGEQGRRMPWQKGDRGRQYYANEASLLTESQFRRLHFNEWSSAESEFIPIEWWDACRNPLPLHPGDQSKLVVGLDAGVTGDCFGMVVVSRDPDDYENKVAVRQVKKWTPTGGPIDFSGPEQAIRDLCSNFNVYQVAYDPYQLHDMATRLGVKEEIAWFKSFNQQTDRLYSDKMLYDLIRDRRIRHDGNLELREHIQNANSKHSKDEDTKLRLVKKSDSRRIDLAVALSMAADECLGLNL